MKIETDRDGLPSQAEVAEYLSQWFPEEPEDEKWFADNWGLFTKTPKAKVRRILLCTTATHAVAQMVKKDHFDLLISHHDGICNDTSHIIYHSTMDNNAAGHNGFFAKRIGAINRVKNLVTSEGDFPVAMTIDELLKRLVKKGFKVDGLVWKNPNVVGKPKLKSFVFCSGLGGILLSEMTLHAHGWTGNPEFDVLNSTRDVYITGELTVSPAEAKPKCKYVIELGHTNSEKPLFVWVRNKLLNRWKNLEVELAPNTIDKFGGEHSRAFSFFKQSHPENK